MSRVRVKVKTLVLDIDQCMANSYIESPSEAVLREGMRPENLKHRHRMMTMCIPNAEDAAGYDFAAVKRPGLDEFLRFARAYFDVIIVWTAGEFEYAHAMVREIFRDHSKPDLVLTRGNVVYEEPENPDDPPRGHKPLRVINSLRPGMIDLSWTLFLDDTIANFREDPENGLHIPQYRPLESDPFNSDDRCLYHLMEWLDRDEVRNAQDVRMLDKSKIFSDCPRAGRCARCSGANRKTAFEHLMLYSTPDL